MFQDRTDAGQRLAQALQPYQDTNALVLAIPKGGIEVGYQVAEALGAEFSIIITRKLPFPQNPEAGFGAIAEDGSTFLVDFAAHELPQTTIHRIIEEQQQEIARRREVLRGDVPLPPIKGRTVILVDDGIAMGSTMRASISLCQRHRAAKIVVAAPVAGVRVLREIKQLVDEVVVLETPPFFRAVAQVYAKWYDVSDQEAVELLNRWRNKQPV
ncbi:phosphoribosyltransferase [candidate division KSB3 bacterium]|uniref:Phosphoribosyltransferase n=1 Tax=candidate division KSB3 bacterium TaxID=2044937 RepID=A0A9D5Q968_9BACT|nr:phosphoribosyltransferase [candidate division KSB3 bacterium]MBD3327571.1 phosphoribosyltransferase [candidate division KSB3 bacterium]